MPPYVRLTKSHGSSYRYLVEKTKVDGKWRQRTLAYLGPADVAECETADGAFRHWQRQLSATKDEKARAKIRERLAKLQPHVSATKDEPDQVGRVDPPDLSATKNEPQSPRETSGTKVTKPKPAKRPKKRSVTKRKTRPGSHTKLSNLRPVSGTKVKLYAFRLGKKAVRGFLRLVRKTLECTVLRRDGAVWLVIERPDFRWDARWAARNLLVRASEVAAARIAGWRGFLPVSALGNRCG